MNALNSSIKLYFIQTIEGSEHGMIHSDWCLVFLLDQSIRKFYIKLTN